MGRNKKHKKVQLNNLKPTTRDNLIQLLQTKWVIAITLNPKLIGKKHFDISVGNIMGINEKKIIVRYFKFFIIPTVIQINNSDIIRLTSYFKRRKKLTNMEISTLNDQKSLIRKSQYLKFTLMKWVLIISLFTIIMIMSFLIVWFLK